MSESPPPDPTLERLEDQIKWYDRKSTLHRKYFNVLKVVAMVAAAAIPFMAAMPRGELLSRIIPAALGALVVVIEGVQQLFQFQTNWLLYRSTCESLKHEK
jgi:lipopolysaccharide export LptBFGC system permease protein LptF